MKVSPPAIMLLGDPGNGKTFSLATIAAHPAIEKLIYIYTDPGGDESLIDAFQFYNVPVEKLHWKYIAPAAQSWDVLESLMDKVSMMNYESLAGLKAGIDKQDHRQFYEILGALSNFTCDRTGEKLGKADDWPTSWAVVFDSLTGLNKITREGTVGAKPTMHQGEWGIAMNMEENFIRKFVSGINCPRVMIGHLDKAMDQIAGRMTLQVSLLGNKLAPQIPHLFSDVIYAYREGTNFLWSTSHDGISLKSRNLPVSDKIKPDFRQIIDKWQARKEWAKGTPVASETKEIP